MSEVPMRLLPQTSRRPDPLKDTSSLSESRCSWLQRNVKAFVAEQLFNSLQHDSEVKRPLENTDIHHEHFTHRWNNPTTVLADYRLGKFVIFYLACFAILALSHTRRYFAYRSPCPSKLCASPSSVATLTLKPRAFAIFL